MSHDLALFPFWKRSFPLRLPIAILFVLSLESWERECRGAGASATAPRHGLDAIAAPAGGNVESSIER
jgi:hypothetical protein